jgi:hypothetical protein
MMNGIVQQLLAAGADIEATGASGATPLLVAAATGQKQVVKLLLAAGANPDAEAEDGITAVAAAAAKGHLEVPKLLLAAGANIVTAMSHSSGILTSPLHIAMYEHHHDVVQLLLRSGGGRRASGVGSMAPLTMAAVDGDLKLVQLLLEPWGRHAVSAVALVKAAQTAAYKKNAANFARLANLKELHVLYPAELQELFRDGIPVPTSFAIAAVVDARAADVSSADEQRAAVQERAAGVRSEGAAVQQLIVHVAIITGCMHSRISKVLRDILWGLTPQAV